MSKENGFKETEIGLIPNDWKVVKLGDYIDTKKGRKPETLTNSPEDGFEPYLTADYFRTGNTKQFVDVEKEKNSIIVDKEDIVLIWDGSNAGDVFTGLRGILASTMVRIIPKNNLTRQHLFYFLKTKFDILNEKTTGSTIPHVSKSIFEGLPFVLPPLIEQQKIALVLSKIHHSIEQQEKIIAKTKKLKRSLMHHLFTYGLRGEELKKTEIGLIPKSWTVIEVGELGEIITGTTPPTKNKEYYMGGGYQFISPFDLGNTKYAYKTEKEISFKGLSVSRCLSKDAVLVVCIGSTIGKVGMTSKDKSATNQQINTIVCDKKYNPHFVYYGFLFKSEYIRSLATPSPVPIMSKGKFQKAVISIPANRDEQDKIAEILSAIDEKVEKAQSRKHALQDLFRSMLNLLMTGQVRVKDIDLEGVACE